MPRIPYAATPRRFARRGSRVSVCRLAGSLKSCLNPFKTLFLLPCRYRSETMPARSRDNHIVLDYVYRFEYLQGYLRHYSVAACFDGSPAPRRKGETSQFTGKPIISITYRGFSREVVPVRYSSLCIAILGNPLLRLTWLAGRLEFVASLTVGVGNRPILAERANVGRSAAPGDRLRLIRPDPASIAVGVGSNSNGMKTVLPFSHCFNPCVCTVGNKPASVPSVGRADTASRYNVRLHFVSCRFQVRTHRVEDHSFRPVNNSVNVFANDPVGSNSPNNPQHFRPEVAVVLRALALACETERLAGETACEHVDAVSPNGKVSVRMSPYCSASGKWYLRIFRQKGSISQLKAFVHPAHSAARSKPPMPLKREAWVIDCNYSKRRPIFANRSIASCSIIFFLRAGTLSQHLKQYRPAGVL